MQVDPEKLERRRKAQIAQLVTRRNSLLERQNTAHDVEARKVKALLISVERSLRWQLAREGLTGTDSLDTVSSAP